MAIVTTTLGEMDDSLLQRIDTVLDNDNERTTTVEYCVLDCPGEAHRTGQPQGVGCFCPHNVHRSVDMELKRGVAALSAVQGF